MLLLVAPKRADKIIRWVQCTLISLISSVFSSTICSKAFADSLCFTFLVIVFDYPLLFFLGQSCSCFAGVSPDIGMTGYFIIYLVIRIPAFLLLIISQC